ncbi:transcriptional regulator [Spongiactinospora rosea]|uniref:Transcriptional regulator n=1 Tax=Spongiactinospora rosea TaxID=2248750 RepID=A0A366LVW7_9ACTN|nr:helix-turn-helix transcriptional regulator [Spongiactinospora rosea]RBQ18088.1 transcriptional regulator [Spongiactinospora rosea]
MVQQPIPFGAELRRRRLGAGLSLTELSRLVHYSKGHLSKVERGLKAPSTELARLCDAKLGAEGALTALVGRRPSRSGSGGAGWGFGDEEVWLMRLSKDGQSRFHPVNRRQVMVAGAVSMAGMGIGIPATASVPVLGSASEPDDTTLLGMSRALFDQYRRMGQVAGPGLLLPALIAQTHALQEMSSRMGENQRPALLRLASRYAEYVGWLAQESGNEPAALWWTQRAVELAEAGGDRQLAAYGLVRRALVTLYQEDAEQTIDLARKAQEGDISARIRGLAAQREAQGHALAGDHSACMRSLDRARALMAESATESDGPVIGTTHLPDPVGMISGWCLHDLGRPAEAAEVIAAQLAQVPSYALRTRVRYGVRHALAYAAAGEIDHACHLTGRLLNGAATVTSATITTDLRKLARALARHPRNAAVRELSPALGAAMRDADL